MLAMGLGSRRSKGLGAGGMAIREAWEADDTQQMWRKMMRRTYSLRWNLLTCWRSCCLAWGLTRGALRACTLGKLLRSF